MLIETSSILSACGQSPNLVLRSERHGTADVVDGTETENLIKIYPPNPDKCKKDSVVYLGHYFVGFKSDQLYKELLKEPLLKEAGSTIPLESRIEVPDKPTGDISDFERILSEPQIKSLVNYISVFKANSNIEIVIVSIDSSWIKDESFEHLIDEVHQKWDVGKYFNENGIVIGVSVGLKKIKITTGAGVRDRLSQADCQDLIDEIIIPEFISGRYFAGIQKGLLTIIQKLQ